MIYLKNIKDNEEKESEEKKEENQENKPEEKQEENQENKPEENQENKPEEKQEEKPLSEEEESKKCIEKFKSDIPFIIYIRRERDENNYYGKTPFIDSKHFLTYSKKLKEFLEVDNILCPLSDIQKDIKDYEIIVQFNPESKYINKKTFDLDYCESTSFEYKIKEEEKKEKEKDRGSISISPKKALKSTIKLIKNKTLARNIPDKFLKSNLYKVTINDNKLKKTDVKNHFKKSIIDIYDKNSIVTGKNNRSEI